MGGTSRGGVLCRLWLDESADELTRQVGNFRRKAGESKLFAVMRRLLDVAEDLPEGGGGTELWRLFLASRRPARR